MSAVLKEGSVGPEVGVVHQELLEAGWAISNMEMTAQLFGPTTRVAVEEYQGAHGLVVDGVVGPKTLAALMGAADVQYIAMGWRLDGAPPPVRAALAKAVSLIGTVEVPAGSNRGVLIDAWNRAAGIQPGSAWCAAFATGMYDAVPGGNPFGRPLGSVLKIKAWATRNSRVLGATDPVLPGDVGLIERDAYHGHAVLLSAVLESSQVATVEGNAGNAVRGLIRGRASLTSVVRPVLLPS